MIDKKSGLIIFSVVSIPLGWGVLQFYHLVVSHPIVQWMLYTFPHAFEGIQMPYPLAASLLNLFIFGIAAAVWPKSGFGQEWKPDRHQSLVVLGLIIASVIYPICQVSFGGGNPFRRMGFVIWTITPVQEEIIFRGFLYSLLLKIFRQTHRSSMKEVLPVILLGSVWFSLWHLSPHAIGKYGWGFMSTQLILTFVVGIVFNILRHWTGSIWFVIPVHAAGNFMVGMM